VSVGTTTGTIEERLYSAALGEIPGASRLKLSGRGQLGGGYFPVSPANRAYPWLAAAELLEVRSTSAQDNPAGTGAYSIRVTGLSAAGAVVVQDITLTGTTAVPIPLPLFRVNSAEVLGIKSNVGTIVVRRLTPFVGDSLAIIPPTDARMMGSHYTIPAGRRLWIFATRFSAPVATIITRLRWRCPVKGWRVQDLALRTYAWAQGRTVEIPDVYEAGTDLSWEAQAIGVVTFELAALLTEA